MLIRIKETVVIVFITFLIILFSILAGIAYVQSNIKKSQESDLLLLSDIADHFISTEIAFLKLKTTGIAHSLSMSGEENWTEVLLNQEEIHSEFVGMAVLDTSSSNDDASSLDEERGFFVSSGLLPTHAELMNNPFIQQVFQGKTVITPAIPSVQKDVVFCLATLIPGYHDRILTVTLPRIYFAQRVSSFVIWENGHIFIDDAEGNILANTLNREAWIQNRHNFVRLAQVDKQFESIASVIQRGVNRETGIGYFTVSNSPNICAFRPISGSEEGWFLGVVGHLQESPFRNIDMGLVVVGIVSFFLSITAAIIAFVFIRRSFSEKERLVKHQASVEAASRAKSSFLATMSHEMRTPMNAIIGMTSIGKNAETTERKDYALGKIEDAAIHLLSVINDVLDISKIEANKLELAPIEFNLERMLQKIINIINFRMDEKRQKFNLNIDRNIPRFVVGDDYRLSQIIMNLLSNAVKFSPEQGEIGLDVTLSDEKDGICEIRVAVSDNGIGISPEQQMKLFSAFEQADSGITREFGGTGLGLSISKHIVDLMGGKIWVESEFGKGSRFIFSVKVERGKKNITSMLAPDVKWENMRVLVVDDEPEIGVYFKDLFAQLGISCDAANDGFEACRHIEESGSFDIYFVDWRMPGMDGIELTRKIKAHDKDRPSVVVMISSADWAVIKETAIDAGVSKYLLKPLFSTAIIECINECLGLDGDSSEKVTGIDSSGRFAGKKLLVAEDVEINREIIISLLEETGISIDCAENGQEAVDMIAKAPDKYDVVLMDVQMPKMDGLEATRKIRALTVQRLESLPIIAMTAHVFMSDIEECHAAGMDDHIGKPIDIDDVLKKLHKYLYAPKSGRLV
jgi:signal transduction histidine kinase/DNA-binding response OmpR family regulator